MYENEDIILGKLRTNREQLEKMAKQYGNRFVRALGTRLIQAKEPACILVQGDSTGNDTNDWPEATIKQLMAKHPKYTFLMRLWNDTKQCFDAWHLQGGDVRLQTGSAGDAYASFPGGAGNYVSIPDAVPLNITGDIDIRIKLAITDWTPALSAYIITKSGAEGNMGWRLSLATSGGLVFDWFPDGLNASRKYATCPALGFVDGSEHFIRVTLDVDNGSGKYEVKFYTSADDGDTWVQFDGTTTGAATTSIYASTAVVELGSADAGATARMYGKIYEAAILNGIDGVTVASPNFDMAFPVGTTSFKDCEGNTISVNGTVSVGNGSPGFLILNASCSGKAIAYSTDETRFGLQTPIEPQLAFINYSHNDGATLDYQGTYEGLATQLLTKYPNVGVVCTTQNPKVSPATNILPHAHRNMVISTLAAKNDYGLIDAYRAFEETGSPSTYINTDGIHPTVSGYLIWAKEVMKFLMPIS